MNPLQPLLGRTLVIVAHPDDECIACGALLQRMAEPVVAYCTDGAPRNPYFWRDRYGSRERYRDLRQQEATRALTHVGVTDFHFLASSKEAAGALIDQELYRAIQLAMDLLARLISAIRPQALLTLTYEGGHPDHDTCNFMTAQLARRFNLVAFEAPLYHRVTDKPGIQEFLQDSPDALHVVPSEAELQRKLAMGSEYVSQGEFLRTFDIAREIVRPIAQYNYSLPPHHGPLNYEAWGWPITGADVSAELIRYLKTSAALTPAGEATGNLPLYSNLRRSGVLES